MIVLDASLTLAWCFDDEFSPYADRVAETIELDGAVAPAIWPLEVANGLIAAERHSRITADDIDAIRELLAALPIEVEPLSLRSALDPVATITREFNLSAYDAAYLELARRLRSPLATLDQRLRAAAVSAGVTLVHVGS